MTSQPAAGGLLENNLSDPSILFRIEDYLSKLGLDSDAILASGIAQGNNLAPEKTGNGYFGFGLPNVFCNMSPCVNNRFYWLPRCVAPSATTVYIGSSRVNQKLEEFPDWFDALRTFACRASSNQILITGAQTSTHRFVKRIGELFQIPLLEFLPMPTDMKLDVATPTRDTENVCYFSPEFGVEDERDVSQGEVDRLLILAAKEVRLLSVRGNGNTAAATKERLRLKLDTRILVNDTLTPANRLKQLLADGATGWWMYAAHRSDRTGVPLAPLPQVPILQLTEIDVSNFLLHWTRRRVGKWPGQSEHEYLDDLIFGSSRAHHDPLAALCRILATDRILATQGMTRFRTPVVCLSEVAVNRLKDMQVFRPHLARWDFLPFGIAFDRQRLISLGTEKVTYGNQQTWNNLSQSEKPFFQIATTRSGDVDWQQEKEWRVVGDLDLHQFSDQQAFVFVPDRLSAQALSKISRWPIAILGQ